ncbi:sugar dehydrogenase complex small subunit [Marinibaculum pumilum]|uniref:Sugar dehydrogenase complex small subunit n=1 Tax=Marinibaculum pumilum TaxID=1766165 RepID=A0ABV7L369_9PROT
MRNENHPATPSAGAGIDRRTLLAGSFALGAALFLGGTEGAQAAQLDALTGGTVDLPAFLALSQRLTGHDDLDEDHGAALLEALRGAGHGGALANLHTAVRAAGAAPEAVAAAAAGEAVAARALLRGWYVGLVAMPGGQERLVGYDTALMAAVTADFIPLRSFCGGAPHFWAAPPELDDLPL